jgi:AraC-like DNA-binding protein
LTDQQSGDHARFLRAPGLRFDDVEANFVAIGSDILVTVPRADRAFFLFASAGSVSVERAGKAPTHLHEGDALGIEKGAAMSIKAMGGDGALLFVSSIPRRHAYIANLPDDIIFIAAGEEPISSVIRLMVEATRLELARETVDMEVVRRLSEIIMLQLLRRVQAGVVRMGQAPDAIRHDAHILRAWSAYFAAPAEAWTVDRLANAAGLSRSAFFERFRTIFGAPPLETLTRIRLDHAKELLTASQAPLPEIAVAVGYQSESALIRAFKREFGVAPGQWRKEASQIASGTPTERP